MNDTKKKVVIAGSSSLKVEMEKWFKYWNEMDRYQVIDWPKPIDKEGFLENYPKIYKNFYTNLMEADLLFVANEDKNGLEGYIGAEVFGELTFAVAQNLINEKNIEIVIYKKPSEKVQSFDEINMLLESGWIKLFNR
jgi:hypothetical protein